MREEGVGHVLVEEGCAVYEVECYSVWTWGRLAGVKCGDMGEER